MSNKTGKRNWAVIILLGLSGQIAWNVENSWFNTFVYDTITPDPKPIAVMVALSAVVATVTTLVIGTLSDRIGRRRPFIFAGYILWALSTIAFPMSGWARSAGTAVFMVILLDALMTFFGSTANDAAFNAWVTDITDNSDRGLTEGVAYNYSRIRGHDRDGVIRPINRQTRVFHLFSQPREPGAADGFFRFDAPQGESEPPKTGKI